MKTALIVSALAAGFAFSAAADEPDYYVEYIESTNGQWIDTDFKPTLLTRVEMDFQLTATTGQSTPYGVEFGSGLWYCLYLNGTPAWAIDFIHDGGKNSKGKYTPVGLPDGDAGARFMVVHDGPGRSFAITNVESSVGLTYNMSGFYTVDGDKCDYNLPLFARVFSEATVSAPGRNAKMKLFSCDIYEDGELVRKFRPAVKGGVPGLWDKRNERFYASKTASAFVVGKKISGLVILLK